MAEVVLITGTSSGFGKATAERLSRAGMRVFGTTRRVIVDPDAGRSAQTAFESVVMDVTDDASVSAGVAAVVERAGRIDVLVNNAGISLVGSVEDTSLDEVKSQLDTNFFGTVRLIQNVLPHMREAGAGRIINVSSIGGLISLPFQSFYSASKYAVEALTEALRHEVRPYGIKVCCIEPGDFRTSMTANRLYAGGAHSPAYAERMQRVVDRYAADEVAGADPELFAALVERLIADPDPAARHPVGAFGQRAGAKLRHWIGDRMFERLFAKSYGL